MSFYPASLPHLSLVGGPSVGGSVGGASPFPHLSTLFEIETDVALVGTFSFMSRSDQQSRFATQLRATRLLTAEVGEFDLNGQDATMPAPAGAGGVECPAPLPMWSLLLTGTAGNYRLVAEVGGFACMRSDHQSRTATMLRKGIGMTCAGGTFNVYVAPAQRDLEMNGEAGVFTLYGQVAGLPATRRTTFDRGAFTLNGQDAFFKYETTAGRVLQGGVGTFSMSRSDNSSLSATTFKRGGVLFAEAGMLTLTGLAVEMTGPKWRDVVGGSGSWVYVTPGGGIWTDVDPDS